MNDGRREIPQRSGSANGAEAKLITLAKQVNQELKSAFDG